MTATEVVEEGRFYGNRRHDAGFRRCVVRPVLETKKRKDDKQEAQMGENMNVISRINKQGIRLLAAVIFIIAMASGSAMAGDDGILRSNANGTYTGPCCSKWDESVTVHEPRTLVPVVVTWSTDYQSNAPFIVGLSLNGGACTLFGSASMTKQNPYDGTYLAPASYQWVILPGDYGLRSGRNVITLCGGGVMGDSDTITIWGNTLVAHLER